MQTIGVVTIFAGREELLPLWFDCLSAARGICEQVRVYAAENSGSARFRSRLSLALNDLESLGYSTVRTETTSQGPYVVEPGESYLTSGRHDHVTRLYNETLPQVHEDILLTLEDDVVPPDGGLERIVRTLEEQADVCAVASAYAAPHEPEYICAAWDTVEVGWGRSVLWSELPSNQVKVGSVGGGCTAWRNDMVSELLPIPFRWQDITAGWDAMLSTGLRASGKSILVDGGCRSKHFAHGSVVALEDPSNY